MKLADESIKIEENLVFGGDKYARNSEHSNGDLLALIDFKRSRISLHKSEFQGTINAMERNAKLAGAGVLVTAGIIILLIIIFFVTESSGSFGIAFRGIVVLAVCYLIYTEIFNIIKYLIHTKGICLGYANKHNIIPAGNALVYCAKVMSRLIACEQNIDKIENTIKNGTEVDINDLYDKLSAIDVEPKTIYETII